jgi:hypothetical protein
MVDVVMDDMAIGNPVPYGPALALWASFPGIHIAQFRSQVIEKCGVIFPAAPQQAELVNGCGGRAGQKNALCAVEIDHLARELALQLPVGDV